jgi:tetratricopeptide (TPR) repeat protein
MRALIFLLLLLSLCLPGPAQAQSTAEIVAEAHALFHQASDETNPETAKNLYSQALLRYEQAYRDQPEAKLAYNIGNTYYRLGDRGQALINYRRAEQDLAADTNLQHNLALVRSQRQDQFAPNKSKAERFNLHRSLSLKLRTHIFFGLYVAFWLAAALWSRTKTPLPTWIAAVLLLATLLALTSVGLDKVQPPVKEGVLVAPVIVARQGDGRNYQAAFASPLHSGTEFVLIQKRGYWLQIELADGRQCWIPSRSAEFI